MSRRQIIDNATHIRRLPLKSFLSRLMYGTPKRATIEVATTESLAPINDLSRRMQQRTTRSLVSTQCDERRQRRPWNDDGLTDGRTRWAGPSICVARPPASVCLSRRWALYVQSAASRADGRLALHSSVGRRRRTSDQGRRSLWDRGDTSHPIFGQGGHDHECPPNISTV